MSDPVPAEVVANEWLPWLQLLIDAAPLGTLVIAIVGLGLAWKQTNVWRIEARKKFEREQAIALLDSAVALYQEIELFRRIWVPLPSRDFKKKKWDQTSHRRQEEKVRDSRANLMVSLERSKIILGVGDFVELAETYLVQSKEILGAFYVLADWEWGEDEDQETKETLKKQYRVLFGVGGAKDSTGQQLDETLSKLSSCLVHFIRLH